MGASYANKNYSFSNPAGFRNKWSSSSKLVFLFFLQKEIKEKITQLASYDYDPLINTDLAELDDLLQELKTELQHVPSGKKEQIIEAMIANYKTRLDILEHVLKRIEKTKTKIKKS